MAVKAYASKVIEIALAEEGYLEKASNSQLDSKTANAGTGNFTKYARDLDALGNFYNTPKQSFDWCDVFVDWCFVQAYGREKGQALLCQPNKSTGAGVNFSADFYKAKGQWHTSNPKKGDQIFFRNYAHTGIVYDVDDTHVYTVEGNTTAASGVVSTGTCVRAKSYALNYSGIDGYGRPAFDEEPTYISANRYLTEEEMQTNALYIYNFLSARGWTMQAVAGMLGNMQVESTINPGIWQNLNIHPSTGFGLVQWTPATKFLDWCDENGLDPEAMDSALLRLEWELENHEQYYATPTYNISFAEFKVSTASPMVLAQAFLYNYERPADPSATLATRTENARKWYMWLEYVLAGGETPDPDEPDEPDEPDKPTWKPNPDKKDLPLWLLISALRK